MLVSFNELAERELVDAALYYERQQRGLGSAFIDEMERCVGLAAAFPQASPVILGNVRRRLCGRFPYGILFEVKDSTVRILAVMNLRRRPEYWLGRN